jgi:cell wall-associated NlpC family hydrolase
VKYAAILTSVLLVLSLSAFTRYPIYPGMVAADTSVTPVGDPEFLEDIVIGEDNEPNQDGGSKKKSASKTTKSTAVNTKSSSTAKTAAGSAVNSSAKRNTSTTASKRVTSPTKKLAALTPDEENIIHDLPRRHRKAIGIELSAPLQFKYAILLDVPVEMINDSKLLETIESWYGTRYQFGGETRKGVDCSAFTQAFMLSYYNIELPRRSEEQYQQSKPIKKKKLHQGDLVFFRTRGAKGGITHVGVYLCNNKFVHASTSSGVMISDLDEDYFKARYAGGGRVK